jgi:hypothetical protein
METYPPRLFKTGQKYRTLYMKTEVYFSASGEIKSPLNRSLRVIWYQAVMIAEHVKVFSDGSTV